MNLAVWKWIRCCNDVMKRDLDLQKVHSCSKNIRGISFLVLKISMVYIYKKISCVILHGYSRS